MKKETLDLFIKCFSESVEIAFTKAFGKEKWDSLSDTEKHDLIMDSVKKINSLL